MSGRWRYPEYIGGPGRAFVEDVDRTCRVELRYLVPEDHAARRRRRDLCGAMPAFENHMLDQHRTFVLDDLSGTARSECWLATRGARRLVAGAVARRRADHLDTWGDRVDDPDGRRSIAERPCVQRWAAPMLGRVLYPGDAAVAGALNALANADADLARQTAREDRRPGQCLICRDVPTRQARKGP